MEKWTRSLLATNLRVGCAVDGTKSVSWGDIFPKTTLAMDVLPERRERMSTMRGARSARSLSPSEGVAGHRSRLAYMAATARGWPLCGAAGFSWRCSRGDGGAAGLCVVLLVSVVVLTRRLRADHQR